MKRREFLWSTGISLAGLILGDGFFKRVYAGNNSIFETNLMNLIGKTEKESLIERLFSFYEEAVESVNMSENEKIILIDGLVQRLYLVGSENGEFVIDKNYIISTGRAGFGNISNTGRTPYGLFEIRLKQGENEPIGSWWEQKQKRGMVEIIQGRNTGGLAKMTTRVLYLADESQNRHNPWYRGIAIHGTNHEGDLGIPASHGCIRVSNANIIELFNSINQGGYVKIIPDLEKTI